MKSPSFKLPKDPRVPASPLKIVSGRGSFRLPSSAAQVSASGVPAAVVVPAKAAVRPSDKAGVGGEGGGKSMPFRFFSKRYQLRKVIPGGQAPVYKAWDRELEMDVVLKFLSPHLLRSKKAVANLKGEAAVVMRLSHENIVRLFNVDMENAKPFIVMEFIDGETLRMILQRVGAVSVGSMVAVAKATVNALAYAHERGVLHRDIKLENIMVTSDRVLKVLDFGSAMAVESVPGHYIEGTPGYMAPEQVDGGVVDGRADVFGLGAVLWEMVTGRPAFPDRKDLLHMYDKAPEGGGGMAPGVKAVLLKAMAKNANERWATIVEFGDALMQEAEKVL